MQSAWMRLCGGGGWYSFRFWKQNKPPPGSAGVVPCSVPVRRSSGIKEPHFYDSLTWNGMIGRLSCLLFTPQWANQPVAMFSAEMRPDWMAGSVKSRRARTCMCDGHVLCRETTTEQKLGPAADPSQLRLHRQRNTNETNWTELLVSVRQAAFESTNYSQFTHRWGLSPSYQCLVSVFKQV